MRARSRSRPTVLALAVAAALAPAAPADATSVTFTASPGAVTYPATGVEGPYGYAEAPFELRTADAQPTVGVQADGGALVCHLDSILAAVPCGPGPSLRPDPPLTPGEHFLAGEVDDGDGNMLAGTWLRIEVDTTAPRVELDSEHGILRTEQARPFAPEPSFAVIDDNAVGGNVDRSDCSIVPHGAAAAFRPCRSEAPIALPHRHRLYDVLVRGTDDLGRTGSASALYDPIPCTLALVGRRPRLRALLSSGIALRSRCDGAPRVAVGVFAYAVDGRRAATPRGAVSDNPRLGTLTARGPALGFAIGGRLRLTRAARSALRSASSVALVVAVGPAELVTTGFAYDDLGYATLTVRR